MEESMSQNDLSIWSEGNCVNGNFLDKPVSQRRAAEQERGKTFLSCSNGCEQVGIVSMY